MKYLLLKDLVKIVDGKSLSLHRPIGDQMLDRLDDQSHIVLFHMCVPRITVGSDGNYYMSLLTSLVTRNTHDVEILQANTNYAENADVEELIKRQCT